MSTDDRKSSDCFIEDLKNAGMSNQEAFAELRDWEQAMLAKHGWYSHYVQDDPSLSSGVNCHTHGPDQTFHRPDLQIVVPLPPEKMSGVFTTIIDLIRQGVEFEPDQDVQGVLVGYPVRFIEATEGGRTVWRVILPDPSGRTDRGMAEPYSVQYDGVEA